MGGGRQTGTSQILLKGSQPPTLYSSATDLGWKSQQVGGDLFVWVQCVVQATVCLYSRTPTHISTIAGNQFKGMNEAGFYCLVLEVSHHLIFVQVSLGTL